MPKKINKPYDEFLKLLLSLKTENATYRWQAPIYSDQSRVLDHWKTLSDRAKVAIVKDSRWNHYPIWAYSGSTARQKKFGQVLCKLTATVCYSQSDRKILVNHSQGIFAVHTLESVSSDERIRMSKRLIESKDQRVRRRVVGILPAKVIIKMFKNKSILSIKGNLRTKLVARIGFDNCYREFLPTNLYNRPSWLERKALKLASREDLDSIILQIKSESSGAIAADILEEIIKKLSAEEVIFFLGDIKNNKRAEKIAAIILDLSK